MLSLTLLFDRPRAIYRVVPVAFLVFMLTSLAGSATIQAAPSQQTAPHRLLTDPVPNPHQEPGVLWFAPTGHTLRGAFLDYWTHYGGLPQFGYPITEEFVEPGGETGKEPLTVQYFERNRFEHHPENAGTPYEVLLGSLGLDFHESDPPVTPIRSGGGRYFDPTGHNVSGPFLAYWESHGGIFVHGYPITEAYYEQKNPTNGKSYLVQYFERSRFEYHPEYAGTPYEVLVGLLGTQLSEKNGYPYGWYPHYGHAADFSWLSGDVRAYGIPDTTPPDAGCATFRYDNEASGKRVQLNKLAPDLPFHVAHVRFSAKQLQQSEQTGLVVFGRMARSDEPILPCFTDKSIPGYYVDQIQTNPAQ